MMEKIKIDQMEQISKWSGQLETVYIVCIHENCDLRMVSQLAELKQYRSTVRDYLDEVDELRKNQHNNYVGYYQMSLEENVFFKLYLLPKIISITDDVQGMLDEFWKVYNHYIDLSQKYPEQNIENKHSWIDVHISTPETYYQARYMEALTKIQYFFNKHRRRVLIKREFVDNTIRGRIDVRRSILELNKSRVHQYSTEEINFSPLAHIARECLHFFELKILRHLEKSSIQEQILGTTSSVQRSIRRVDTGKRFLVSHLITRKCRNLFLQYRGGNELYRNLLALIGSEHNLKDKIPEILVLQFLPEKMYERSLQYKLEQIYGSEDVDSDKEIHYYLKGKERVATLFSRPDFRIKSAYVVMDAKWKVLQKWDSTFDADISKLKRDAQIIQRVHPEQEQLPIAILVYPKIGVDMENIGTELHFDFDPESTFYVLECGLFESSEELSCKLENIVRMRDSNSIHSPVPECVPERRQHLNHIRPD